MEMKELYSSLYCAVLEEHKKVFEAQNMDELLGFLELIKKAQKIFVMGAGREGIAARSFAMRLMHLGKEVHWIWDDTTPGMHEGDLFIAVNGPGTVGHITYVVERGKENGATTAVVTGAPRQTCPQIADYVLFVPAAVYKGTDDRVVPSIQPMGNLFEQHLFLLFDIIIMMLEESMQISHDDMETRHRNVE